MGRVLAVAVSAVLAVVLVVVLFGPYFFTGAWPTYPSHGSSPVSGFQGNVSVASVEFSNAYTKGFPEENIVFNGTHVVYTYTVEKPWTKIVLSDGTVIEKGYEGTTLYIVVEKNGEIIKKERYWPGSPIPLTIKYRKTEVADLIHRKAWAVEEAWTEALGLQHYKRTAYETTFQYKWVPLEGTGGVPQVTPLSNTVFKAYLSFTTYVEHSKVAYGNHAYTCSVMEPERAKKYLEYAGLYSKLLKETIGVELIFEEINKTFTDCRNPLSLDHEVTWNNISVINVVELAPTVAIEWERGGAFDWASNTILLKNKDSYVTFLHELGHALGMSDLYSIPINEPLATIYHNSIMWNLGQLSLGDLATLIVNLYVLESSPEIKSKASEIGINVENASILLPLTPDNKIPPAINELIKEGIVKIDPTNPENTKTNTQLLNLLKTITKLTQNTTS